MGTAWVGGFAAYPCRSHGKSARKLFGGPFFHGFWLCVAWVRPKLYLTHAPYYSMPTLFLMSAQQFCLQAQSKHVHVCRGIPGCFHQIRWQTASNNFTGQQINRCIGLVGHRIKKHAEPAQTTPKNTFFDPNLPLREPRKKFRSKFEGRFFLFF